MKNMIPGLLLACFVSSSAIAVQGADTARAPQLPVTASHAAAIFHGVVPPDPNALLDLPQSHHPQFVLKGDATDQVTVRDVAQDFLSICKSVGSLCRNTFLFFAQYRMVAPAIFVGIFLTNVIGSVVRRVMRSK
jgi:hypothetical protein